MTRAIEVLGELVQRHGDDLPLAEALWALALEEAPRLDPAPIMDKLERWAEGVSSRPEPDEDARARAVLFEEAGFSGDTDDYYQVDNSLLHRVIERRRGLPITLSIVYIEVVRRAGGQAEGVGFPGHFLTRHQMPQKTVLLDPFRGAQRVKTEDLEGLLPPMVEDKTIQPWMLEASSGRAIVTRVLANLKNAYVLQKDLVGAVTALDRLLTVSPNHLDERRDRGLLYGQLGLVTAAVKDLEAYVEARPDAADVLQVEALIPRLKLRSRELS